MSDTLKTAIINALNLSARRGIRHRSLNASTITAEGSDHAYYTDYDADRLTTAIRDHVLDREKVQAALLAMLDEEFSLTDIKGKYPGLPDDTHEFPVGSPDTEVSFNIGPMVDRLIEGLTR